MKIIATGTLTTLQKEAILSIWNEEYPSSINYRELADFNNYLDGLTDKTHFLLTGDSGSIDGWAFRFSRNEEPWFAILLHHDQQRKGYGQMLLDELKNSNTMLCGWAIDHSNAVKQNGTPYNSPLPFYLKNDFVVIHGTRLETETISAVKIEWRSPSLTK